ncbi:hypothetical protein AMK21_24700 [Streptomyces sp. CB00316]|uniref:hypothetical protein n=1 Tax=Streptomyces sp. CB00316 TaxID=1703932 RepID=UPI0009405CA6|nr:hypothetical protein [Streptomyces sp. CB00316]OKJ17514.1 hypothetical protein AMK21_24700 [Streptomyces sp. CB00316]
MGALQREAVGPQVTEVARSGSVGAPAGLSEEGPVLRGMWTVTVVVGAEWPAVAHCDESTRLCDPYGDAWESPLSSRHGEYRSAVAFAPRGSRYAAGHLRLEMAE